MLRFLKKAALPVLCIGALTACSNNGGLLGSSLTTSSIDAQKVAKKPAIDPACVTLVSKIDSLRKDGITDRVAKAGAGKSKTVPVYRTSLARMAELDRANAEYQRRCGTLKPATASVTGTAVPPAVSSATKAAATNAAKKTASKAVKTKAVAKATTAVAPVKKAATKATTAVAPVKNAAEDVAKDAAKKAALDAAKKEVIEAAAKNTAQ